MTTRIQARLVICIAPALALFVLWLDPSASFALFALPLLLIAALGALWELLTGPRFASSAEWEARIAAYVRRRRFSRRARITRMHEGYRPYMGMWRRYRGTED
jgi:hypothetical protein